MSQKFTYPHEQAFARDVPLAADTAPVITGREDVTDEIRAAAADYCERRTRELIAQGASEHVAIETAADESILYARRLVDNAAHRTAEREQQALRQAS